MTGTDEIAAPGAAGPSEEDLSDDALITKLMDSALQHLGMHMSWVSHVAGGEQKIDAVVGDSAAFGVSVGDSSEYESSYCHRVLGGGRFGVVADAATDPRTAQLPITRAMRIGAYAGAPIRLPDGRTYGMLCCFSRDPMRDLSDTDAKVLAVLAGLMSDVVARREARNRHRSEIAQRVNAVRQAGGPQMVYQPIYRLADGVLSGFEALARFPDGHGGPDRWFADAAVAGCQAELELAAIGNALAEAEPLLSPQLYLGLNASSELLSDDRLIELLRPHSGRRLMIEVTEHDQVHNYPRLQAAAGRLRQLGASIAADDAGAGFAGLRHLVDLAPDCIKIDISIVRNIDTDPVRQAMTSSLVAFAAATGARLVAEGIETQAELVTVTRLGVQRGQGFLLGRPQPLVDAIAANPAGSH